MTKDAVQNKTDKLLQLKKSSNLVSQWTEHNINLRLNSLYNSEYRPDCYSELLADVYHGAGIKAENELDVNSTKLYKKSYELWKMIWYSKSSSSIGDYLNQLFHVVATGIMSESFAEIRMMLLEVDLDDIYNKLLELEWKEYLENTLYLLVLLVIRKKHGWDDMKLFDSIVQDISRVQDEIEEKYYSNLKEEEIYSEICYGAALLNVLEAIEVYKAYVLKGKPDNVEKVIMRFCRDSIELLNQSMGDDRTFSLRLFENLLIKLSGLTVWSSVGGISEKVDEYIKLLTIESNSKPIFELWPSQHKAVEKNLFDNTKTAVVVQMPTSAGKTLLSKFYILQTLNLYTNAKIAYIVPTRALVNQVKRDLRRDFEKLNIKVDVSIPYADIEEIEDKLLLDGTDIIVTTPEKLDILTRMAHPIITNLRLLVVDEAHGIQDENRGAKLELLLAMLRKENRNLRVLLLSPFMQNAENIANWLGANRGHDIYVNWKPSQQFTGTYKLETISRGNHKGAVTYIPSSLNTMHNDKFKVDIHKCTSKSISKVKKAVEVAKVYEKLGGILILCIDKKSAETAASEFLVKDDLPDEVLKQIEPLLLLVDYELGVDSLLYKCIKKGCAYHHSSLPLMIREEIEEAICKQLINVVSSTTTLAQGMNFPISTVIFQGMTMPSRSYSRKMMPSEFWNIAGRAGRALVDKEGHIIAICETEEQVEDFKGFLSNKNQEVVSSLVSMIKEIPEDGFSRFYIRRYSELSALLQYIYHIVLVDPSIEVDDLLRGSLVFHQLEEEGNSQLSEKLIRFTRKYIASLERDKKRKKLMESIDKTGLSSVSMHYIIGEISRNNLVLDESSIFAKDDDTLRRLIELITDVPEINLGLTNTGGKFNPELVARITKAWVNGESIKHIANNIIPPNIGGTSVDEKIRVCGEYIYSTLINNLPWGLAAAQRASAIVNSDESNENDVLIPAYIYFGVKSHEAVAFSMLGVPRFFSNQVGEYWLKSFGELHADNLSGVTEWLGSLDEQKWNQIFSSEDAKLRKLAYDILQKQ